MERPKQTEATASDQYSAHFEYLDLCSRLQNVVKQRDGLSETAEFLTFDYHALTQSTMNGMRQQNKSLSVCPKGARVKERITSNYRRTKFVQTKKRDGNVHSNARTKNRRVIRLKPLVKRKL